MKLTFTEHEYKKLTIISVKLMRLRSGLPLIEWKKSPNNLIKMLVDKFNPSVQIHPEGNAVYLNRNQIRFLEGHILESIKVLEGTILPEYIKRGVEVEPFTSAYAEAQFNLNLYKNLLTKLQGAL